MAEPKIRKWCHFFFSEDGCQRGAYCTFAHSAEDFGKNWWEEREQMRQWTRIVQCKFFTAGAPRRRLAVTRVEHTHVVLANSLDVVSVCQQESST